MTTIGNNIKLFRRKLGLTQEELALQLSVTSQAVSRWESNAGMPDISMIVPLAKILSVSIDALFGLEQSSTNEMQYIEIRTHLAEIEHSNKSSTEIALCQCEYLFDLLQKNPANHVISCCYVERTANLSRDELFIRDQKEKWAILRNMAIQQGTQVIRFCDDTEWVERTHFALSWIYIHERDYHSAREHINTLPSIASNRLRESLLAQLASFESGQEGMREVFRRNMQLFTRAINKEILYAVQDIAYHGEPETAILLGQWGIEIMHILSKNRDMLSFCRGFTRDIYKFIIHADLRAEKYEDAVLHFQELEKEMQHHFDTYQYILNHKIESEKQDMRTLDYMRAYTSDFIAEKKKAILSFLKEENGEENYKKFTCMLNIEM